MTGTAMPAFLRAEFVIAAPAASADEEDPPPKPRWVLFVERAVRITVGVNGVFSHFPILLAGLAGAAAVMHRHWPLAVKSLALATLAAFAAAVVFYVISPADLEQPMFSVRWLIPLTPLLLFWACGLLRKRRSTPLLIALAMASAFSIAVALIGAARPFPDNPRGEHTAVAALRHR